MNQQLPTHNDRSWQTLVSQQDRQNAIAMLLNCYTAAQSGIPPEQALAVVRRFENTAFTSASSAPMYYQICQTKIQQLQLQISARSNIPRQQQPVAQQLQAAIPYSKSIPASQNPQFLRMQQQQQQHLVQPSQMGLLNSATHPVRPSQPRPPSNSTLSPEALNASQQKFFQSLSEFMKARGTPIDQVPKIGGRAVNLYQLYLFVNKSGGYKAQQTSQSWAKLGLALGFELSSALQLEALYRTFLLPWEEHLTAQRLNQQQNLLPSRPQQSYHQQMLLPQNIMANLDPGNNPIPPPLLAKMPGLPEGVRTWSQVHELARKGELTPQLLEQSKNCFQVHARVLQQAWLNAQNQRQLSPSFPLPTRSHPSTPLSQPATNPTAMTSALTPKKKPVQPSKMKPPPCSPPAAARQIGEAQVVQRILAQGGKNNTEELEKRIQALSKQVLENPVRNSPITLSPEDQTLVRDGMRAMHPMYTRIEPLCPLFLHITGSEENTKRLIWLKMMFKEQHEKLAQNVFIMTPTHLTKMREQIGKYFQFVRGYISNAHNALKEGNPLPTPKLLAKPLATPVPTRQQQQPTLAANLPNPVDVQDSSPSFVAAAMKHTITDLKLPPTKKKKISQTTSQSSVPEIITPKDTPSTATASVASTSAAPTGTSQPAQEDNVAKQLAREAEERKEAQDAASSPWEYLFSTLEQASSNEPSGSKSSKVGVSGSLEEPGKGVSPNALLKTPQPFMSTSPKEDEVKPSELFAMESLFPSLGSPEGDKDSLFDEPVHSQPSSLSSVEEPAAVKSHMETTKTLQEQGEEEELWDPFFTQSPEDAMYNYSKYWESKIEGGAVVAGF